MNQPLCIYHGNCADGFTAAWVVNKYLKGGVELYAATHGDPPPDVTDRDVIIVDFSYKRPVMRQLADSARSILVLDHHKTAEAELAPGDGFDLLRNDPIGHSYYDLLRFPPGKTYALFDTNRSGAMLAWNFFFPGTEPPTLVKYVQDRDLWKFELLDSRAISSWLFSYEYTLKHWEGAMLLLATDVGFKRAVSEGKAIDRKHLKDIQGLVKKNRMWWTIGDKDIPVCNLPYTMASDAAGMMAEGHPFAACYFDTPEGRVFSLRSRGGGDDVSEVAKTYGGGHRNAAGFRVPHGHLLTMPSAFHKDPFGA